MFFAVLVACVGCDHATKRLAESALSGSVGVSMAADAVRLELASNPGAFLGMGAALPDGVRDFLLIGVVPLALLALCAALLRSGPSPIRLVGLALLAGGGLGNWLDRVLNDGAVTDFISLGVGGLRTGIFNLADVAVVVGILLLCWRRSPRLREVER